MSTPRGDEDPIGSPTPGAAGGDELDGTGKPEDIALLQLRVMRMHIGAEIDEPAMKAFLTVAMNGAAIGNSADFPTVVNKAWLDLSPHQRALAKDAFAHLLGSLDGIPLKERDQSNVMDLVQTIRQERSGDAPSGGQWTSQQKYFSPIRQALLHQGTFIIAPGYTGSYANDQPFHDGMVVASQNPSADHISAIDVRVSRQEARAIIAEVAYEPVRGSSLAAVVAQQIGDHALGNRNSLVKLLAGFRTVVSPNVDISVRSGPEQWIEPAVREVNSAMARRGLPSIGVR
ncbi:MAG: hypothetical protein HOQ05_13895 [Corynebacteriales bacterium]|nr:hypothetical protein [Mycobacteriales bacterium]